MFIASSGLTAVDVIGTDPVLLLRVASGKVRRIVVSSPWPDIWQAGQGALPAPIAMAAERPFHIAFGIGSDQTAPTVDTAWAMCSNGARFEFSPDSLVGITVWARGLALVNPNFDGMLAPGSRLFCFAEIGA